MNKLAMRNAWTGVDAKYTAILELGIAPSGQVYKLAAEASRNLGDVREQQQRLRLAQGAGEDVSLELEAIERAFGTVRIASASGKKLKKNEVGPELTPAMSPFAPDLRAAIESARKELQATGTFSGMLPAGDYTAGSKAFTVVAGDDSQVLYEAD